MKTLCAVPTVICSLVSFMLSCTGTFAATQLVGRPVKPDSEAVAAGNRWLAMMDTGNYKTARHTMVARVRRAGESVDEQWLSWARTKRAPLGRIISRSITQARFSNTWPGAPDGTYEWIAYKTVFERKAQASEYLVLTKESGHWEVSGYGFR